LMPNHYHLMIKTPKGNISRSMRHLNGVYTQKFNKRHKIDGSLFRGRYKSILVEEERYLLELVRYIHRNPLKAVLEEVLGEYKWCSQREYMNEKHRKDWLTTEEVLLNFSKYEKEAKRRMKAFVEREVPADILKRLEGVNWPAVMGGKEFKEKVKKYLQGKEIEIIEKPGYRRMLVDRRKKEEVREKLLKENKEVLERKGSRKKALRKRALIYVLRKELDMTLREIAEAAGGIRYSAVSNQYKKSEEEINKREGCYREVRDFIKSLNVK